MEFYREMLGLYCNGFEDRVAKMTEALETENWSNYTVYAHGLKSTSLSIGGERVSAAAKELELAGKAIAANHDAEANKAFIKEHHEAVKKLYEATVAQAGHMLEN